MLVKQKLFIGGKWVAPSGRGAIDVHNAGTGEVMGRVPAGTERDVDAAVAAAHGALEAWSRTPVEQRAAFLQKISDGLKARAEELAKTIAQEVGMPIKLAGRIQAGLPIANFANYAKLAPAFQFETRVGNSVVVREPVGVVGAITPCGACYFCQAGDTSQCAGYEDQWGIIGGWRLGNSIDGVQAEYFRVPYAQANLAKIPDDLSDEQCVLLADIGVGPPRIGGAPIGDRERAQPESQPPGPSCRVPAGSEEARRHRHSRPCQWVGDREVRAPRNVHPGEHACRDPHAAGPAEADGFSPGAVCRPHPARNACAISSGVVSRRDVRGAHRLRQSGDRPFHPNVRGGSGGRQPG